MASSLRVASFSAMSSSSLPCCHCSRDTISGFSMITLSALRHCTQAPSLSRQRGSRIGVDRGFRTDAQNVGMETCNWRSAMGRRAQNHSTSLTGPLFPVWIGACANHRRACELRSLLRRLHANSSRSIRNWAAMSRPILDNLRALSNDMELDPVEKSFIIDGPSMGGPCSEGLEVCFSGSLDVAVVNRREGDQLDRINLDHAAVHAVATTRLNLRSPPQPEGQGDVPGRHVRAQLAAELHGDRL